MLLQRQNVFASSLDCERQNNAQTEAAIMPAPRVAISAIPHSVLEGSTNRPTLPDDERQRRTEVRPPASVGGPLGPIAWPYFTGLEPLHGLCGHTDAGGLRCPDLSQRRQHYSAWRRCAFHSGLDCGRELI